MYCNKSLKRYLSDLSKKLPTPGGGSASALVGGLGVSLLGMAVNFTVGKPQYQKYEKELREILKDIENLRDKFLKLVDEDVMAYKSKDIQWCLKVPLEVSRICFSSIKLCPLLIKKTNPNLISDIACALVFLEAGFFGGYFNVEANLKFIKDKKMTDKIRKEILTKAKIIKEIRQKTEDEIGKIIRR